METFRDDESSRTVKGASRTGQGVKTTPHRVRTLRMLAAQTEWLQGPLRWQDDRVVWTHSRGVLAPTAADLSAAQRSLYQVARYPHASARAFGDGEAWLAARQARLEEAKRLHLLRAPDLAALVGERSPEAIRRLVELISAEALCINGLPASPCHALVRAAASGPEPVVRLLLEFIVAESVPHAGRGLAAVTLGALARNRSGQSLETWLLNADTSVGNSFLKHAYRWGAQRGLPEEPGLAVALLLDGGTALLERWRTSQNTAINYGLGAEAIQAMLASGTQPERVVTLCESMGDPQRVSKRLAGGVAAELDNIAARFEMPAERMQAWRDKWRQRCQGYDAALAGVVRNTALETEDPDASGLVATFIDQMLDLHVACTAYIVGESLSPTSAAGRRRQRRHSPQGRAVPDGQDTLVSQGPQTESQSSEPGLLPRPSHDPTTSLYTLGMLWQFALRVLRSGQALPSSLRVPYLRLLVEEGPRWWDPGSLEWGRTSRTPMERREHLRAWLRAGWSGNVQPLVALLKRSRSPELCGEAVRLGVHAMLSRIPYRDTALYAYALQLTRLLEPIRYTWLAQQLYEYLGHFPTAVEARISLGPVVDAVGVLPREMRSDALDDVFNVVGHTRQALSSTLPRLAPHLKRLFGLLARYQRTDHCYDAVEALLALDAVACSRKRRVVAGSVADEETDPGHCHSAVHGESPREEDAEDPQVDDWLNWLLEETYNVEKERESVHRSRWFPLGLTTRLSAQLADGNFARFQEGFRAIARSNIEDTTHVERGLNELHRYPRLSASLAGVLAAQPGRVLKLLERLGLTQRLGAEALRPLDVWRAEASGGAETPGNVIEELPEEWRHLAASSPAMAPLAIDYVWLQQIRGEAADVPAGVRRALEMPRKLEGELRHLETLLALRPERADLSKRAATLSARLRDRDTLHAQAVQEACERLGDAVSQARLSAGECSVESCFRVQLQGMVGRLPPEIGMNDDWFNAVLLSVDIEHNRKLSRQLLRAEANGDRGWRDRLPGNITFLRGLSESGIDVDAWMATHRKRYRLAGLPGGWVHLCLERDSLQILQMGNAFGTCLSAGGINAFSTVANACEANKRVLFARDSAGRIVARKLLAVNAEGALVGFHTYAGGAGEEVNAQLRSIVARYAHEFASRCGLKLADGGEVPLLFVEQWYDDGIVPWSRTEVPDRSRTEGILPSHSERRNRHIG